MNGVFFCLALALLCFMSNAHAAACVSSCFSSPQLNNGSGSITGTTVYSEQCSSVSFNAATNTGAMYTLNAVAGKYVSFTSTASGSVTGRWRGTLVCTNCNAGSNRAAYVRLLKNGLLVSTFTTTVSTTPQSFTYDWNSSVAPGDVFSSQVCVSNIGALASASVSNVAVYAQSDFSYSYPF